GWWSACTCARRRPLCGSRCAAGRAEPPRLWPDQPPPTTNLGIALPLDGGGLGGGGGWRDVEGRGGGTASIAFPDGAEPPPPSRPSPIEGEGEDFIGRSVRG